MGGARLQRIHRPLDFSGHQIVLLRGCGSVGATTLVRLFRLTSGLPDHVHSFQEYIGDQDLYIITNNS